MTIYSPQVRPQDFGFKFGDTHLIVNAVSKTVKAFDFNGVLLFEIPALADGQHPNWRNFQGDTPPGLYKFGAVYNDYDQVGNSPSFDRTLAAYGWLTFDMIDLEGNEDGNQRGGICAHGGGTGLGWPSAWAPYQDLLPTWGCVRMHNADLREKVLPRYRQGICFVSVYQDDR